jgi:hypothetical protein
VVPFGRRPDDFGTRAAVGFDGFELDALPAEGFVEVQAAQRGSEEKNIPPVNIGPDESEVLIESQSFDTTCLHRLFLALKITAPARR